MDDDKAEIERLRQEVKRARSMVDSSHEQLFCDGERLRRAISEALVDLRGDRGGDAYTRVRLAMETLQTGLESVQATRLTGAMVEGVDYRCAECGVSGVRLWRQYQTFASKIRLLCTAHALADQNLDQIDRGGVSIGWLVPARPVDGTFWGQTSGPQSSVDWWDALPETPPPEKTP